MSDRDWCPECGEARWSHQVEDGTCGICGSDVMDEWPAWPAFKHDAGRAGALIAAGAFLLGPPAMVVVRLLQGGPLYRKTTVTRTVTEVQHTGVLVDVAPVLAVWLVVLLMFAALSIGPRRL